MDMVELRSRKQIEEAVRQRGMWLIVQRCATANRLPHAHTHRQHTGWRVVISRTCPETTQDKDDIESDASKHIVDVCNYKRKEAFASALAKLGWTRNGDQMYAN